MKTYTVQEAASETGLTAKSIRRRIERKTVASLMGPDGRRRLPEAEVLRLKGSPVDAPESAPMGQGHAPEGHTGQRAPTIPVEALLTRLETLAAENGRLRALTETAESAVQRELDAERRAREIAELALFEARARVAQLEQRPPRWWRKRPRRDSDPEPSA